MARKKVKVSGRFFIIFFVLTAVAALIFFLLTQNKGDMRISAGTMEYTSKMKTVIIRNEQITNAENWGKIVYIASEGVNVSEGDTIARVYKAGYNERALQDLAAIQKQISEYIENTLLKGVINPELSTLKTEMDALMQSIGRAARGIGDEDILALESQLIQKMEAKQSLLRTLVQNDKTLDDLLNKETAYKKTIKAWETDIKAGQTGTLSFYFDGCEAFLTPDNISSLTRDDVLNLMKGIYKTKKPAGSAGVSTPLYRIVNNVDWYCLFLVDELDSDEFIQGATYTITFDGYYTQPYEAEVVAVKELDLSTMFVMHITQDIGSLSGTRQAVANISKAFNGYIAPLNAISKNKNGVDGIRVMQGNEKVFIPVEIIYSDGKEAVISVPNNAGLSPNERLY